MPETDPMETMSPGEERETAIRARLDASTARPWTHGAFGPDVDVSGVVRGGYIASCGMDGDIKHYVLPQLPAWKPGGAAHDAEFLAHAPHDIAYLLDALAALRQQLTDKVCPLCGSGEVGIVITSETSQWRDGPTVSLEDRRSKCQDCGEEWYDAAQSMRHTTALLEATVAALQAQLAEAQAERLHGVTWLLVRDGAVVMEQCSKKARVLGVGEWFIPGGKLEPGETTDTALFREMREEWPGVELLTAYPLPVVEGSPVPPGPRGLFLMRPYLVEVRGEVPSVSGDGVPLQWVPVAEALDSPVPQVRMMIAAALASPFSAAAFAAARLASSSEPPPTTETPE